VDDVVAEAEEALLLLEVDPLLDEAEPAEEARAGTDAELEPAVAPAAGADGTDAAAAAEVLEPADAPEAAAAFKQDVDTPAIIAT